MLAPPSGRNQDGSMEAVETRILLFDDVEVLDFAGPFEVFSIAETPDHRKAFNVKIVAESKRTVVARNGLKIVPDLAFSDQDRYQLLIVPGGRAAETTELANPVLLGWLREQARKVDLVASVCTGALLLAKVGLLDGLEATTHWMDIPRLQEENPEVRVKPGARFVDQGRIITSAGISAGIDMSLHIVERYFGKEASRATARRMEYDFIS